MKESVGRCVTAVAAIGCITLIFSALFAVNALTVGFTYLVTILIIAANWGLEESVFASATAAVCLNYFFLPPFGTLSIEDPRNWVGLFAFLVTSLIGSQLSERAKRRAQEAIEKQIDMEHLYELSRGLMLTTSHPIGTHITLEVARIYSVPAVALFDRERDEIYKAGLEDVSDLESTLRDVARRSVELREPRTKTRVASIGLGGNTVGSIAIRGVSFSDTAFHALRNLISISLESALSRERAARAEAARHSERFKSTLLDGLAHEFKTPLTSIKAAASALLTSSVEKPDQQRELLSVIDQESSRLNELVTEAMHLSRIEAGKIQLNRGVHSVKELVESTVKLKETALDGRAVEVDVGIPDAFVSIDFDLIQLAFGQLLDNAAKYSPRNSPIRVRVARAADDVMISVHNSGAVPGADQERIFERFYRGTKHRDTVTGTGMGLAIAREILHAHGGDVRLESSVERGTEFRLVLRANRQDQHR